MNKNNLEFDAVSVDQKNLESLIVFQIEQISSIVKRTSVGQFIKSSPFELSFPMSIGKSKWILFLFLNGQYEDGQANDLISIYLKLVQCDHQSAELNFDVKFQFGMESATVTQKNQRLCFASVKTRWFGAKLIKISEMILNGSRFIQDDVLMLTVSLNEHINEDSSSSAEMFCANNYSLIPEPYIKAPSTYTDTPENNYSLSSQFYVKPENRCTDPPHRYTKTVPLAKRSKMSMFRVEPYARSLHSHKFYRPATPKNSILSTTTSNTAPSSIKSDNEYASTNGTGQVYRRNIFCDSNMNYVDNEYSDDEDAKSTDSKKGFQNYIASVVSKFFKKSK